MPRLQHIIMHILNMARGLRRLRLLHFAVGLSSAPLALVPAQHVHADTARRSGSSAMSMERPLGISMERMGSGTTWIPDAIQLPSRHFMAGEWTMMFHGFAFGLYDWQDGPRGGNLLGSLNWAMLTADRQLGGGRLQ